MRVRGPLPVVLQIHARPRLRELLRAPLNMYARDDEGNSALHLAVRGGHAAAARVLLEAGFGPLTRVANRVRRVVWGLYWKRCQVLTRFAAQWGLRPADLADSIEVAAVLEEYF